MAVVVLNDFSPAISYTPSLRLNPKLAEADGWTALFDGQQLQTGAEAIGAPAHTTNLQGAALAIQFVGSAITLRGTAFGPFDVSLDGVLQPAQSSRTGILYEVANASSSTHTLSVLALNGISVTGVSVPLQAPPTIDFRAMNSSGWTMSGSWQTTTSTTISDNVTRTTYSSAQQGDSISMRFQGGSVVVKGLVSPAGGLFNATIDGTITSQLDSFSPWIVRTELFFLTGLDPNKPHTLMLANAQPGTKLQFQSIEVSLPGNGEPVPDGPPEPPPASSGLPQGTVIALIVAAVVAFICLLIFLFFIWRHLYRRRRRHQHMALQSRSGDKAVSADNFVDIIPSVPNSPTTLRYPRPPRPPAAFPPSPPRSSPGTSKSSSPMPTVGSTLRRKFERAAGFLPAIKDNSVVSSNRSLGRRSYIRSINSLHQQYVYDSRDRDDVAINTPDDPDAGFRKSDEFSIDKDSMDFAVDADAVFAALSKPRPAQVARRTSNSSINERHVERTDDERRRTQASFLEFMSHASSSKADHSGRTGSMIRSMTASEMTASTDAASASIPFFSHINRTSIPPGARVFDAGAVGGPALEMTPVVGARSRPRLGIVSFQQQIDHEPLKTPSDSIPRSISPHAVEGRPTISSLAPTADLRPPSPRRHSGQTESEQYYTAATGTKAMPHSLQSSGSSGARPAVPSGESSRILQLQTTADSPVPSSFDIRGTERGQFPSGRVSPLPPPQSPPPLPPSGPPPLSSHPFASAGSSLTQRGAPPVAPPVTVNVLPASPLPTPGNPLGSTSTGPSPARSTPSPPAWPLSSRSHKERVLRKILGPDNPTPQGFSRPPLPSFDRS